MSKIHLPAYTSARLLFAVVFCVGVLLVALPFVHSVAWALVIVASTWPAHAFLKKRVAKGSDLLAASISTGVVTLLLLVLLVPLSIQMTHETTRFVQISKSVIESDESFEDFTSKFPGLPSLLSLFPADERGMREQTLEFLNEHQAKVLSAISFAARGIGRFIFGLGVTMFTCFYLFRCGESLANQFMSIMGLFGGEEYQSSVGVAWATVRAVLYGVVMAALAQGFLAGVGFYIFGAPLPLLFGCATVVMGLIPFGPPVIYFPMALYLVYSGSSWFSAVGLALWGIALVSTADNIFRPLFISRATSLPILLAFFGGLGGILAFGMIGLFLGPVLLALSQVYWNRLVERARLLSLR